MAVACWSLTWILIPLAWWGSPCPPHTYGMIHALTVVFLVGIAVYHRRHPIPPRLVWPITAFLLLHALGARYAYSSVPYQAWCEHLLGSGPDQWFGWQRNHYDRLVHLAFGLLLGGPSAVLLRRHRPLSGAEAWWLGLLIICFLATTYELLEWGVALALDPADAEAFNGQQGDPFDPHADIGLALLGYLMTWPLLHRGRSAPGPRAASR